MGSLEDVAVLLARRLLEVPSVGLRLGDRLVRCPLGLRQQLDRTQTHVLVGALPRLAAISLRVDLEHLLLLGVTHNGSPCADACSDMASVAGMAAYSSTWTVSGGLGVDIRASRVWWTIAGEPHTMAW